MNTTLRKRKPGTLLPVVLLVVLFSLLPMVGRYLFYGPISQRPEYRLKSEMVRVTPPPDWVKPEFVQNVLHASGLDAEASLLDDSLPLKLSQAFSADPWVEEVRRVEIRYPSGAVVDLVYRHPVALVAVDSQGLYPIDGNGVLLPTDYFIEAGPEKRLEYPVVRDIVTKPLGTVGTRWGDPMVYAAGQLGEIVRNVVMELGIAEIQMIKETSPIGDRLVGRLRTADGVEIVWGRVDPKDPKNEAKIRRLQEMVKLYGSLDSVPPGFQPIDLTRE